MMLREKIQELSFDGEWFRDQALRQNGVLMCQDCVTEVCQYYAFFFGVADKKRNRCLFERLLNEFGRTDKRRETIRRSGRQMLLSAITSEWSFCPKREEQSSFCRRQRDILTTWRCEQEPCGKTQARMQAAITDLPLTLPTACIRDVLGVEEITEKRCASAFTDCLSVSAGECFPQMAEAFRWNGEERGTKFIFTQSCRMASRLRFSARTGCSLHER